MRKIIWIAVLVMVWTAICCQAMAESTVVTDKAGSYDNAVFFRNRGDYREAAEAFKAADDYEGSEGSAALWYLYCLGMVKIEEADDWEEELYLDPEAKSCISAASTFFGTLEKASFADAASLAKYCRARMNEYIGNTQPALEAYNDIPDVLDSYDRCLRLRQGIALVNVPHESEVIPVEVVLVSSFVKMATKGYAGPGKEYPEESAFQLSEGTPVLLSGQRGDWRLAELETESGKVRVWVLRRKIDNPGTAMLAFYGDGEDTILKSDAEVRYGPGEEYLSRGTVLPAGTGVKEVSREGYWSLVIYTDPGLQQSVWGWVMTETVQNR